MRTRRQAYGQHFLVDQKVIQGILAEVSQMLVKYPADGICEIGPGKEALTTGLLQLGQDFYTVEKDPKFATKTAPCLLGDFVQLEPWMRHHQALMVVSNLPYSSATAIAVKLTGARARIVSMVLMFQKEVADRMLAEPSTPHRGSLSLFMQNVWEIRHVIHVSPHAFAPPPRVQSSVLAFVPRKAPIIASLHFERILRQAFSSRRKMLRGLLPDLGTVDGTKRAEALGWDEWQELCAAYEKRMQKERLCD